MESKAKLLGHPIHQMLIVFPLGLLATAVIFDGITLSTADAKWSSMAFYMMGAGIAGGLIAAVFGLIDWLAVPSGTRARAIGLYHGVGNLAVVLLFLGSWWLRRDVPDNPGNPALTLSFLGIILALVTAWLGGELVNRLAVGVDEGAHLDAPNSITHKSATGEHTGQTKPRHA